MDSPPLLQTRDVVKRFGEKVVLDRISTSFQPGKIYGLLGPNGAGKTTFIRTITRIYLPDEGGVFYKGHPITAEDVRHIGYLPEERGLYQKYKVGDQLMYLARLKGLSRQEAQKRLMRWLEKFDAADWWDRKVNELSKGMQQKLQFILTVVHDPELIILDEPFTGFDPINTQLIKEEIEQMHRQGKCIIFSTHRMEQVEELCEQILFINEARLLVDEEKHRLKERYKAHLYEVVLAGPWEGLREGPWEVVKSEEEGPYHRYVLRLADAAVFSSLMERLSRAPVHVHRVAEMVPSLHDIFIQLVNSSVHENV